MGATLRRRESGALAVMGALYTTGRRAENAGPYLSAVLAARPHRLGRQTGPFAWHGGHSFHRQNNGHGIRRTAQEKELKTMP